MESNDFVVRFAGEGGQGQVTAADALARAAAKVGYHIQTFSTFPSQILGGPTFSQVRISTKPVLSAGDELDVLVALNREAVDMHRSDVRSGGVCVYNSEEFESDGIESGFGIEVNELAKSTGNARAANMVMIGAVAELVELPLEILESFVTDRFTRGRANDQEIITANHKAIHLGADKARNSGFRLDQLAKPDPPKYDQLMIAGNAALAMGAKAAGLDMYVGYPISPATTILVWMENNLTGPGNFPYQVSSEIEAIGTIVGAGFAGKKAMTATAGPGFSLMSEGLGLAWMAEIPCVVVDVQRGGPSTGLPTKTEQSDLFICMHPAHGDAKMPVIAPGEVEECFFAAVQALNWAERYQGPVVVITEMQQADRTQNIRRPNLDGLVVEAREVYKGDNGYRRYESESVSPMPIPGGPGAYVGNGSEHDFTGDTTHRPDHHIHGTERRFGKLKLLNDGTYEEENSGAPVVVMPWGASKGVVREAYNLLKSERVDLGWIYTMFLHPLPDGLLEILRGKDLVIVPELNYQGQWSSILRSEGVQAESITRYDGLPFKYTELAEKIRVRAEQYVASGVVL